MRAFAGLALLSVFGASIPALAAGHDGAWQVTIVTESGQCDRAYGYGVEISGGKVRYVGEAAISFTGTVSPDGAVRVSVSKGQQRADGTGRLRGTSGSGTWKGVSGSGACAGTWQAEKRG